MKKDIEVLEQRVGQAVKRLRELREDRQRLGVELESLRERLVDGDPGADESAVNERRERAVAVIREALAEIRAE